MANIILPPNWQSPERDVTPEEVYLNRRRFLKSLGIGGLGVVAAGSGVLGCADRASAQAGDADNDDVLKDYAELPHRLNEKYVVERDITPPGLGTRYNNAYEFTTDKDRVWKLAQDFTMQPWEVEVAGLCEKKGTYDYTDVVDMDALEERRYRFRCVEAWSMTVPWIGFPMKKFVEWAKPDPSATHLRFVSVLRPEEMPGQKKQSWYPWPYYEALRMDEAMNDLTLLVVGMYGKELTPQNGGPIRVIAPWKYGYKSPKYIVRIEFTDKQPPTFWNDLAPKEYSFLSNVNPNVPHPRWSQATERLIDDGRRIPTQLFNGYQEFVADLYPDVKS